MNACRKFGPPPQAAPPSTTLPLASNREQSPEVVEPLIVPSLTQLLVAEQEYMTPALRKHISPAEQVAGRGPALLAGLVRDAP